MISDPARPPCPTCGAPAAEATRPFCSPRCRDVDLQRWLSDVYVLPLPAAQDEDPDGSEVDPSGQRGDLDL